MAVGWQDWSSLRQPDGSLVFRTQWSLVNGSVLDIVWNQTSDPTSKSIAGFMPMSANASAASAYEDPQVGGECSAFQGIGLSEDTSTCVFDGSATQVCRFSCIGLLQNISLDGSSAGIPGPLGALVLGYNFSVLEAPYYTAPAAAPVVTIQSVSVNLTLTVSDPSSFVEDPNVNTAIVRTFADSLSVPASWISLSLSLEPARILSAHTRWLAVLGSVVRIGVSVAAQQAVSQPSGSTTAAPSADALAGRMRGITVTQLSSTMNTNLKASGADYSVNVQSVSRIQVISQPQTTTPALGPYTGPSIVKKNAGRLQAAASSLLLVGAFMLTTLPLF